MAKRAFSAIGEFFDMFGSAVAVSRAIDNGRRPDARHLRALGIDPRNFDNIRRF
jgi:hypothetical protein